MTRHRLGGGGDKHLHMLFMTQTRTWTTTTESFKKGQSRIWFAKINYEKNGTKTDCIVYLMRRGNGKTKKSRSNKMIYAASGSVFKDIMSFKHSEAYDKQEVTYAGLQDVLSKKI